MSHGPISAGGAKLAVRVVTPEGTLYRGDASFVAAPASDGEVGVLPSHTPLISKLGTGVLRVMPVDGGPALRFAVHGGFLQVVANDVTVLATEASAADKVAREAVEKQYSETLAGLRHPGSDEEFEKLLDARRWIEARQKLS